ncbi:toxin-antitoxin system YwqK family antitoxin [Poseidonibacter lekithochrous]|uniref:toxin-antitoxin system YwqK family antitoxin n=1 Tax=Poseidonibacter lekithochrous TaxID=1904463 RepID=UPI000D36B5F0|nr:hypothetical protein [Poseidonibacter lekithochrous]
MICKKIVLIFLFSSIAVLSNDKWMKISPIGSATNSNQKKETIKVSKPNLLYKKENIKGLQNKLLSLPLEDKLSKDHIVKKEYYKRGVLKKSTSYLKSKKDGVEKEFYINGKVMIKTNYLNGKKHGIERIYDESGKVYKSIFYKNGKKLE